MKVPCNVIRDLLPLYHDSVCSPETAALVEEHLKDCDACQEEFHKLQANLLPLPLPVPGKEEQKAEGIKKVKRILRRKHVITTLIAIVVSLSLVIGSIVVVQIPILHQSVKAVNFTIEEIEGVLTIDTSSPYGIYMTRVFCPDETHPEDPQNGSILVLGSNHNLWTAFTRLFHSSGEPESVFRFEWPITEEGWWKINGEQAAASKDIDKILEEYPHLENDPYLDYYESAPVSPEEDWDFQQRGVRAAYYYEGYDGTLVDAAPEKAMELLEKHGTLLWTAEDGVVYNP